MVRKPCYWDGIGWVWLHCCQGPGCRCIVAVSGAQGTPATVRVVAKPGAARVDYKSGCGASLDEAPVQSFVLAARVPFSVALLCWACGSGAFTFARCRFTPKNWSGSGRNPVFGNDGRFIPRAGKVADWRGFQAARDATIGKVRGEVQPGRRADASWHQHPGS